MSDTQKDILDSVELKDPATTKVIKHLFEWHEAKIKELEHIVTVPSDGSLVVQVGAEEELAITGDIHKGFILGVNVALMAIGELPFSLSVVEIDKEDGDAPVVH